jgi:hypothetical protein
MLAIATTSARRHPDGSTGELDRDDEGEAGGVGGTIFAKTNALLLNQRGCFALHRAETPNIPMASILPCNPREFPLGIDRDTMYSESGIGNFRKSHLCFFQETDITTF